MYCTKNPNISKSIRKSIREEAVCTKTYFQLENIFENVGVKRPAVRKHAARHRPVRSDKDSIQKRTFKNLDEKVKGMRPFVRKHNFNLQTYSKAYM